MTFKEVFDQAISLCTDFANDQNNARYDFGKHVKNILEPLVDGKTSYDSISVRVPYGREYSPAITGVLSSTAANTWYQPDLITFKIKCERGQHHHSYYADWTEYKAKSYADVKIIGCDEEESARLFDTMDVIELINLLCSKDAPSQVVLAQRESRAVYERELAETQADLVKALDETFAKFLTLDETDRKCINLWLRDKHSAYIANW